jgi:predicted RNA-binding protein with RPS1 domain
MVYKNRSISKMKIIKIVALGFVCLMTLGIVRCNITVSSTVKAIEKYYEEITLVSETVLGTEDEDKILKAIKRFDKETSKYYKKLEKFMDIAENDDGMISDRVMKKAGNTIEKIEQAQYETIPPIESKIRMLAESSPKIRSFIESN